MIMGRSDLRIATAIEIFHVCSQQLVPVSCTPEERNVCRIAMPAEPRAPEERHVHNNAALILRYVKS